jgi:hypothetical protein
MIKSARFVIEKTITPVIALYKEAKGLGPDVVNEEKLKVIKHTKNQAVSAKVVISQFKKTGDLYKYLQSSISYKRGETEAIMHSLNLIPFEDIMDEFKSKYKNELEDYTIIQELVVGNLYSTFDFIFLAEIYRTQTFGMLSVRDSNDIIIAVIARGSFKENNTESLNKYLAEDQSSIKYNFSKWNSKYFQGLKEQRIKVYFFETVGPNSQVFKGIYKLESYNKDNHYIILKRDNFQKSEKFLTSEKLLNPNKKYRKKFELSKRTQAGHSGIGKLKEESGAKAEQIVNDFLCLKNIENKIISERNNSHKFDIEVKNLSNLEVKNISNIKGFYISHSEIQEFKNGNTRICLVDIQSSHEFIYISKTFQESKVLQKVLKDLLEIKEYTIHNYNGKYKIDSIEIGLIKPEIGVIDDIYDDFLVMNKLTQSEINNYLTN